MSAEERADDVELGIADLLDTQRGIQGLGEFLIGEGLMQPTI